MDKKKILIVDDDKDLAKGLSVRLEANGYVTVFAADARSGMKLVQQEKPDLILLDLGLPDDNGFILMQQLEEIKPPTGIPVIVISGRSGRTYKEPALIAGAKGYLQKPVDNDELLAACRKALADTWLQWRLRLTRETIS